MWRVPAGTVEGVEDQAGVAGADLVCAGCWLWVSMNAPEGHEFIGTASLIALPVVWPIYSIYSHRKRPFVPIQPASHRCEGEIYYLCRKASATERGVRASRGLKLLVSRWLVMPGLKSGPISEATTRTRAKAICAGIRFRVQGLSARRKQAPCGCVGMLRGVS